MPTIDRPGDARSRAAPRASLFRSGVGLRLLLAAALSALVWLAIGWALAA